MPKSPLASQLCSNFGAMEQVFRVAVTHTLSLTDKTVLKIYTQKHNQHVMPVVFIICHCECHSLN